jgi:uncharacterized protein YfiM (DUF2279 family)
MKKMAPNKRHLFIAFGKLFFNVVFLFITSSTWLCAQSPDTTQHTSVNKRRLHTLIISSTAGYGLTLTGLHQLWYKNSEKQSFRFFNDNAEWKQIDKIGHFHSSFYFSYGMQRALKWSGVSTKKTNVIGTLTGFLILVPIEIFDGFSDAYGASTGDIVADAAGATFFLGQQMVWNEIRLHPKFSFHRTRYATLRPEILGDNTLSEIFKDYNGQTYWISLDTDKFIKFPTWLNIAVGYGAQQMVYAHHGQNSLAGYDAYRQFYLSLDIDLTAFKTKSKLLNTLIFIANMIKIPAPTLELSRHGARFHPLYF